MKFDVVTIGSTTFDSYYETKFKIVKDLNTATGKAYLLPLGEKMGINDVYSTLGGNAANAAVTFANQGLKTGIFTKVGDDAVGVELIKKLKVRHVDTRFVEYSKLPTARSVLLLQNGERTILSYHGAINEFSLKNAPWGKLKAKWWYVSLPGESYKLLGNLLRAAKKNGVKVALNPSFKHMSDGRADLLRHLKDISFLVVNNEEAALLTGISFKKGDEVFKRLDKIMPGIVAITSGPKGVTVSDGKFIYKAGTFKEKKLVDRTGAGDAFGSGFVSGLIKKNNIEYAIRFATANATATVEKLGATEGLLEKGEFDKSDRFKNLKITKQKLR
jgi:ribokinase